MMDLGHRQTSLLVRVDPFYLGICLFCVTVRKLTSEAYSYSSNIHCKLQGLLAIKRSALLD